MSAMTNLHRTSHEINVETADALRVQGKFREAVNYYRAALNTNGKDYSTFLKMSDAILEQRIPALYPISLACCEKSLHLRPGNPLAFLKMGSILKKLGRLDEAVAALQQALLLDPGLVRARFSLLDILCPVLYKKEEDIVSCRTAYDRHLKELCDSIDLHDPAAIEKAALAVGIYPFHLGYQGFNDKDLQRRFGELVCRIQAARFPQWCRPVPPPPHTPGVPLRVGFVSGFFHYHATWKILSRGWLEALDKKRFTLYGYYTGSRPDSCTAVARLAFSRFVEKDSSLESLCRKILADQLHVLIFPDIGMNKMTVRLAALRLAPVQCTSWGHSTTSGLPTMDYFLSSDLMEPPDGDDHYTETLIRLPNLGFYYSPPDIVPAAKTRAELGLKKDAVLYLCIQSLFKYLPQYDEIFPRIARKTGNCQFVFITGRMSIPVIDIFRRRLAAAFAAYGLDSADYVVFFPLLEDASYFSLHRLGDVFLDSIGWSGCNTSLEAIACDLPVVTLPGSLMRGRQTMAMLKRMDLTDTIADSLDHYVEIAAQLGSDSQWRKQIRDRVAAHKHKLYKDTECINYLEEFLLTALE